MVKFDCASDCICLHLHHCGRQCGTNQFQRGNSIWKEFYNSSQAYHILISHSSKIIWVIFAKMIHVVEWEIT